MSSAEKQYKLSSVGGESWDSTSAQLPPRSSVSKLLGASASSVRQLQQRTTAMEGSLSRGKPGVSMRGSAGTGAFREPMSPARTPGRASASPKPSGGSKSSTAAPAQAASASATASSSSMPFKRTAAVASRRQMVQAMKSTAGGSSKDTFRKTSSSRMALAHRLHHMGFNASSDKSREEAAEPGGDDNEEELDQAMALAQSALARRAFQEALRLGKVRPRTLKLMFVGQGRAGKTSTLKALTGQSFREQEESTHGLHAAMPLVSAEAQSSSLDVHSALVSQWKVVERSEQEIHGAELTKTCAQYVAERIRDTCDAAGTDNYLAGVAQPDMNAPEDSQGDITEAARSDEVTSKMSVDLVARMIQSSSDGQDDDDQEPVMLKTWDFGGQREYYVMHHLFLTNRGIYLVVTRLDAWLASSLDAADGELNAETGEDGGAFEPPLEALTFWLSSIHVHAPDALILIVGTHVDRVAKNRSEVEARVEEEIVHLMERVPGVERQVVVNSECGLCFFPVDNSCGGGPSSGLLELRGAIDREAANALAPGGPFAQELPLPWVRLREMLEDAAEGSTGEEGELPPFTATFVLSLAKVRQMGEEAGISGGDEELLECLRCLHNFGSVVFFDEAGLREHVVLNPQWLADAMAHILNCPRVVQGGVAAARRLRERGELEDDLLRRSLWRHHKFRQHTDVLLQMLHRFDLVIPAAGTAGASGAGPGEVHVVPSLLPFSPRDVTLPPKPGEDWHSLFFDFHGLLCRLLPTLFPKLVAASSRQADVDVVGSLGVYRDSFRLFWMERELTMDLLPHGRPQVVRVQAMDGGGLSLDVVQSLLRLVKVTLAQNSHLSFTAGVLCEHCHARGRSHGERHHVIDISELLADRLVPCRHSARVVAVPEGCWAADWRLRNAEATSAPPAPPPQPPKLPPEMFEESIGSSICDASPQFSREGASSPAHTVSTEMSLQSSRLSVPDTASAGGSVVSLLYASPLWRSSENGGAELPQLDVQQEASMLFEVAGEARASVDVGLATASNLAGALTAAPEVANRHRGGLVLHLSLHCGDGGQVLLLEDEQGGTHEFSLQDLRGLLEATGGAERLQLVFLHACCSDLAGSVFVAAGAPHVVCCRGAVFDATARAFTKAFYRAFCGAGKSVAQAFEIARFEIRTAPQPGLRAEAEKYFLLPDGDSRHRSCFCGVSESGPGSCLAGFAFRACSALLPVRVEDFCGRARDIWVLMQHLSSSRRCVVAHGVSQIGKSALLSELARFAGSPGRKYEGRVMYIALSPEEAEEDLLCEPSAPPPAEPESPTNREERPPLLAFLRSVVGHTGRLLQASAGSMLSEADSSPFGVSMEDSEDSFGGMALSAQSEARIMRGRIVQHLQRIEANGQRTLLVLDDLDPLLAAPGCADELRRILTEILLRTERLELLLGARQAQWQALGAHKVVGYAMEPLRRTDAARLFLWRVHRPLVVADLSEAGVDPESGEGPSLGLPLIMNAQNRGLVLQQLANHPLLELCDGLPGHLRATADHVLPGNGTLWDIYRRHQAAVDDA